MSVRVQDECPRCFYRTDAVTNLTGRAGPRVGAVTVCLNCGGVFLFDERLQMRELTEAEADVVMKLPMVNSAVKFIKERGPLPPAKAK